MACALWISLNLVSDPSMKTSALEIRANMPRPSSSRACFLKRASVRPDSLSNWFLMSMLIQYTGRGQPWYGKSGWGHSDYVRKSVSMPVGYLKLARTLTSPRHTAKHYLTS